MEVATAGGVRALVMLARFCNHEGVQEQVMASLRLCCSFIKVMKSNLQSEIQETLGAEDN
jgi:hypothetical protein